MSMDLPPESHNMTCTCQPAIRVALYLSELQHSNLSLPARRNVEKGLGAWLKLAFDERFKGILHRSHTYSDKTVKDLERILSREEIQCEQILLLGFGSKHITHPHWWLHRGILFFYFFIFLVPIR